MATTAVWTILSSSAAMPSGRRPPSGFGMYRRRDGSARQAPRWRRSWRSASRVSRSTAYSSQVRRSTPGAASLLCSRKAQRKVSRPTWCSSAVSFSFPFLATACRRRSCAWDTAARLRVRTVLCSPAFPSIPPLGSIGSAAADAALFADFPATMGGSDFSGPCITGYGLRPSRCGPGIGAQDGLGELPVPAREACAHARVFDDAEPDRLSRWRGCPCCLRGQAHPRRSGRYYYRRSMAGLRTPLPTLRPGPRGPTRTARGRCGSLLLHRGGLAPPTSRRSPGAHLKNSSGMGCRPADAAQAPEFVYVSGAEQRHHGSTEV